MFGMPERHVYELLQPKCVYPDRRLRRGDGANLSGNIDEPHGVRVLPRGQLLRRRRNPAPTMRGRDVGCRWKRCDGLRALDELRLRGARHWGRDGHDKSHVRVVCKWDLFDLPECKLLHDMDIVLAGHVREHRRHRLKRPSVHRVSQRNVLVDIESKLLPLLLCVRCWNRANGASYFDQPAGVFGLSGRHLLRGRNDPQDDVRIDHVGSRWDLCDRVRREDDVFGGAIRDEFGVDHSRPDVCSVRKRFV
jgi:hypothetical protein